MELLTPEIGLMFWTTIAFLVVLFLLTKFAWKPIVKAIEDREENIQKSLDEAKHAREEMAKLTSQNEQILKEARIERESILKEAKEIKERILAEAKEVAQAEGSRIIAAARDSINAERVAAVNQIKEEVAVLSVDIAKKILQKELSSSKGQEELIENLVNQAKLN